MVEKRLYTEADVRALPAGSELVLGPQALATPSALDAAFERGIAVRYQHEVPRVPSPSGAIPPQPRGAARDWETMLARDGTYVVVVRAGRPSVTRLDGAGPQPIRTPT